MAKEKKRIISNKFQTKSKSNKTKLIVFILFSFIVLFFAAKPVALTSIKFYQQFISPYNGSCAYRYATGGLSCSTFAYQKISSDGVLSTLIAMPQRFRLCHETYEKVLKPKSKRGAEFCVVCSYLACCHDW
jgi:putative component of membrane protein insertase Oxa1/YidC/SpoIIIJ protein YidD